MIKLDDISVRQEVEKNGDNLFSATLLLKINHVVTRDIMLELGENEIAHIKESLMHQIMREVYGELRSPIYELLRIAKMVDMKYAESADIMRLQMQLEALL